jgi:hypothetical protein
VHRQHWIKQHTLSIGSCSAPSALDHLGLLAFHSVACSRRISSCTWALASFKPTQPFSSSATNASTSPMTLDLSSRCSNQSFNAFDGKQRSTCAGSWAGNSLHSARTSADLKCPGLSGSTSGVPTNRSSFQLPWSHQLELEKGFRLGSSCLRVHRNLHPGLSQAKNCTPRLVFRVCKLHEVKSKIIAKCSFCSTGRQQSRPLFPAL